MHPLFNPHLAFFYFYCVHLSERQIRKPVHNIANAAGVEATAAATHRSVQYLTNEAEEEEEQNGSIATFIQIAAAVVLFRCLFSFSVPVSVQPEVLFR